VSNHHHNPLDPRDPVGAYIWYNIITGNDQRSGRGRGPNDSGGCGCLFLMMLAAAIGFAMAVH
jgi:hypothetical protein